MAESLDDDEGKLQWHEETSEPLQQLADYVTGLSQSAIGERGSFSVFMSGSNFLSSCLRYLIEEPQLGKIDWSKWHVVWTNETFVPPDQPDIIDNTLGHDGILSKVPPGQVHILDLKLSPQDTAAVDYELVLRELVRTRGSALPLAQTSPAYPRFDLVIVGSELDDLVASVVTFPPVVQKSEIRTALAEEESRPPPLDRAKFTLPLINAGANVSFVAARAGKAGEMKLTCSAKSPFGDIPASASAAAPHKANLVWFKQIPRQIMESRGVNVSSDHGCEGELFGCCASPVCDHTFHWQSEVGGIYRPTLEVVQKLADSFLLSPVQRNLVLEHARNGLQCENVWNWGEAIEHYKAMDAELGKQLEASGRKETDPQRDQLIYLWLHTWAFVPILWFQQFVKGEIPELSKCIVGWETLRIQWPSGTLANLSIRRQEALAMLELSHHDGSRIDVAVQAAAVDLYPNERSPSDVDFAETLPRMTRHLHQHHKFAADEAKAKQWLQKTLEILAGHDAISMPLYPVVLNQIKMLEGPVGTGHQNSVNLEMAQDLMRKLQGELEKRKGSRAQIKSSGNAAVGDVAGRWRDIEFAMAYDRHIRQYPGVQNFTNDKSVEYSLKIIEKDLSTDTLANCLRTSKSFIVQERFEDALKCLDLALGKLPREPGFHNLQRRVVLDQMALCHLGLSRNKPEAGFSHIIDSSSSPLLRFSEPYFRNVLGLADAEIQATMRQIAWDHSHSDGSTGSSDVHLENVISCCREASALSSLPGGFTVLRLSDLSRLGRKLVEKESSLFDHWCRVGEVTMEDYLKVWNEAWGVLHKFLELSSRLMHARWNPLYIENLTAGRRVSNLFEKLSELLSNRWVFAQGWFVKTLLPHHRKGVVLTKFCPAAKPLVTFHGDLGPMFLQFCARSADFTVTGYELRKLIYSERGRARTLMLQGGSLLTTEARDHFLKFSLDDNFAADAMRRSISACGSGCLFVSLSASDWRIYITCFHEVTNPFSRQVQGLMQEIGIEQEACFRLRGILQKTLELLSSSWLRSQREDKSRQLDEYLEQLFEIVVRPIEPFFTDMNPEQKLIFCASNDLSSIPFPILRNRETGRYLFQDHTVSVTPSLRALHPCSQRYEALKKRPLAKGSAAAGVVIADPKYPDEGSSDPKWRRLQGSGSEANEICSLFSGSSGAYQIEKLQRENATVENLFCQAHLPSSDLSYQGFIHVAAHAKVDKRLYPRGVLVLSHVPSDDNDDSSSDSEESDSNSDAETETDEEGSQNTRGVAAPGSAFGEVAAGICRGPDSSKVGSKDAAMMVSADGIVSCGFEWSAALVVLSACDSVKGELYPEGVHNLPRAFMMAGVPCVVVSQWNVSDEISPKLMEIFYTCLREGKDVASALRSAMCQMLAEKHCLYLFAPFLVWGLPNVCLPEELRSKPLAHDKPPSQDIAAGSKSSNLAAVVQSDNSVNPGVVNDDRLLTGDVKSSSSDHEKTPSLLEKASCSGSERETMVPPSLAENSAPKGQSAAPSTSPKKEEFQELSRSQVLLENFTQNYLIDKTSAGICLRIGARALTITLGDDSRYWEWVSPHKGATFRDLAFLWEVSRLEIKGRFRCSLPPGTYTLSWRLLCFGDILAFAGPLLYGYIDPLKLSLEVTGNEPVHTQCRLTPSGAKVSKHQSDGAQQEPGWRWDPSEWMELDAGEFSVANDDSPVEVQFSMEETDEHKTKKHLLLDGIVIRPSTLVRQDQAIRASPTSGSGSGLHDNRNDFVSYAYTGTAQREALLARPAPPRGDHDAWQRDLQFFKDICRIGLANEDRSSLKAAKAESQLESMREEINRVKATNARLEHARQATSMKIFDDLQRVMQEKAALEADIVRLQEQLVKVEEANDRGKKKVVADDA